MKAYCIKTATRIAPFLDPVADIPILNQPLYKVQQQALELLGIKLVDTPPNNEPYLLFSDRIWFTAELVRFFVSHCQQQKTLGRMHMRHSQWDQQMSPLQDNEQGYDLAIVEGEPNFSTCQPVSFDWQLKESEGFKLHVTMQRAQRPLWESPILAHHITHWSHVLRVNQLAIGNRIQEAKLQWKKANFFGKCWQVLSWIFRLRSLNRATILRRVSRIGKHCTIHPTAVIEACEIGDNVEIGPYAVVRGSIIGSGTKIEEHATVNISVVGDGCQIGRYATSNLCVLFKEALISHGGGLQGCVFGARSFGAIGVQILDLSFGRNVQVEHKQEWVDSGQMFLGAAVGHRVVLGNAIRINYGVSIPNDTIIVASTDDLIRDAQSYINADDHPKGLYQLRDGKLYPLGGTKKP